VEVRVVVDTNCYVDFARGDEGARAILESAEQVLVPVVVIGELRAGFALGTRGKANESGLVKFLAVPGVEVLAISEVTTHHYARLFRQLREQGTPVPTNDLWIAALVVEHDAQLYTRDAHFKSLPQLSLVLASHE
jgi:tRNA(fMet)-specific endonuclease VapC